ncbi:MAG: sulfite exporter TauE/SafE family protein [Chakrabartia sp.]
MSLPTDPIFYGVAAIAVILVGVAKGGFAGLGAAAMPILVLVMDPAPAAAMLLPILIAQDIVSVWAFRRDFDVATLKLMLPGGLVGVFLGWLFATAVPVEAVRGLFGIYRLALGRGVQIKFKTKMPNWLGIFWGGVSGFTSQVAHAGGPPFQVWALSRNFPHTVFIGTSAIFFAILNWMKVPAYFALGQFTAANMKLTLIFMPLAIASTFAGVLLVRRLSAARFNTVISLLMVGVGVELLRQSLS